MLKHADNKYHTKGSIWLVGILSLFFLSACTSNSYVNEVDRLNDFSYAFHYRNLDSTTYYARKALALSDNYSTGKAEAYNNLAFVHIARMEYDKARILLDSITSLTDNQLELLVSDIQQMRLCQRKSQNKNFYDYKERALRRLKRIGEETDDLSEHSRKRLIYASSEFAIVSSTYYYYVGLTKQSLEALNQIDPFGDIQKDTAQYLNYLYQVGSGGIITSKYKDDIAQKECEILFKCYTLADKCALVYWEANSLQSMSEHLLLPEQKAKLLENNSAIIKYLNDDNMPDSLLAGYFAQRSLDLFTKYGDIYQIAGAYRTLSLCYWDIKDYTSSLICLEKALDNTNVISQAPDLVASIREQLSLVYSALNDKVNSDINRNRYLDLQDETRQDRELEARAEQLKNTSNQLNILIITIIVLIFAFTLLLLRFNFIRKTKQNKTDINSLLKPLVVWNNRNQKTINALTDDIEEAKERLLISRLNIEKNKRLNLENRAKVFLISNVIPYIDRIINEIRRLSRSDESGNIRSERLIYINELTDSINGFNDTLTGWIQLQQGEIGITIESFNLRDIFDMLSRSEMSFKLKGLNLKVNTPDIIVKADKILTLFMLNTLADNARKFTPEGGTVNISAEAHPRYVEISVKDNGYGMTDKELSDIFERKISNGHGFGLMNCKGIVDKYRKTSNIFNVCGLFAESKKGEGSRFFFRLPYGIMRVIILTALFFNTMLATSANAYPQHRSANSTPPASVFIIRADAFADSAYYCNIRGEYSLALSYADSARINLNRHYKRLNPGGTALMAKADDGLGVPSEIKWFHDNVKTDYNIIMDIRNEAAIAALALHQWDLYHYNNKIYTQLFNETSADRRLPEYCATMQRSHTNKTIAVFILVFLLCGIICSYYFIYYKNILFFKFCTDGIGQINDILLSKAGNVEKLEKINAVNTSKYPERLQDVAIRIRRALSSSITTAERLETDLEQAEDELRRSEYEKERLYICNNIINNCLSTLKHETMYYPARIKQLVNNAGNDIKALNEVASYYKELYTVLYEQAQRQTEQTNFDCRPVSLEKVAGIDEYILGDKSLVDYLFDILKKTCNANAADITLFYKDTEYITLAVKCRNAGFDKKRCLTLFTPATENIPFLICRRIIRETGERTNLYGCGITAEPVDDNGFVLKITLPSSRAENPAVKSRHTV